MNGIVDDYGRALVRVTLRNPNTGTKLDLEAWIDTGFTASLILLPGQIAQLNLARKANP